MKILNWEAILWDCLEEMKNIPDGSIDCIITDPPYGTTACKWDTIIPFDLMWEQLKRIIKPNGAIVLFWSEPFSSSLRMSNIKQYNYDWKWDKDQWWNFVLAKKQPMKTHEDIIIFNSWIYYPIMTNAQQKNIRPIKDWAKTMGLQEYQIQKHSKDYDKNKRYPKSIIRYSWNNAECNKIHRLHPTQKPVALIEYLIKTYTNEWETVLDFTAGSFTTAIASENTNRKWICIEKEQTYFDIWINRINSLPIKLWPI